ncbi:MAG TPA: DUF4249 domain-containing protein [Draconibacterium sp.]|nr:DUF4249 domain-containing protein [Draconibacterium sp.]
MKRRINKYIVLIISTLSVLFSSCEDVVQVDLDESDLDLVSVEAYVNTKEENNVHVKLERTLPVDQTGANPPINGALVQISDDSETPNIATLKEYNGTGTYLLPPNVKYKTEPGRTYFLEITLPDGVEINASDYLRKVEPLDSVKVNLSARGDYQFLAVFINAPNYPSAVQYYKWDIYINGKMLYKSQNMVIANDELVDGNYIYDFEIFTDFAIDESDKILFKGDTVKVEQLSISQSAYDFYIGMINQAFTGSPYSVPPANLSGNLTSSDGKKVLGIFSARDISMGNTVVIGDDNFMPLASRMSESN